MPSTLREPLAPQIPQTRSAPAPASGHYLWCWRSAFLIAEICCFYVQTEKFRRKRRSCLHQRDTCAAMLLLRTCLLGLHICIATSKHAGFPSEQVLCEHATCNVCCCHPWTSNASSLRLWDRHRSRRASLNQPLLTAMPQAHASAAPHTTVATRLRSQEYPRPLTNWEYE